MAQDEDMQHEDILRGAAAIADELIERLCAIGVKAASRDIEWNDGRGLLAAPEYIQLRIKREGGSVSTRVFRRADLEDAGARRLTWHVQRQINEIVSQYACLTSSSAETPPQAQLPEGGPM